MQIYNPKTPHEYMDLVDQAIFEIEDVLACALDEDGEEHVLTELLPLYEFLIKELKQHYKDLVEGTHNFGHNDSLSIEPILTKWGSRIPCSDLLNVIVHTYKRGFK